MRDDYTPRRRRNRPTPDAGTLTSAGFALVVFAVAFVGVVLLLAFLGSRNPEIPRPPLTAEIRTNGTVLFVKNPSADDYDHAEITIRSGGQRYAYTEKIIRPGQTAELPLRWFVADDGTRFDPLALAVQSVTISAAVTGVRGESTYEFSR